MAKGEDDSNSLSSCASLNAENYSQLLQAFKETHGEANRLALLNNRLKGLNNWLENRVKTLEEELENSKTDLENLELHYKNSSCLCHSKACKIVKFLKMKSIILLKLWINFQRVNLTLKLSWHPKNVFLENLVLGLIHKARKMGFQSVFQKCQKNNRLKNRNNWLLHVFIAGREATLLHSVKLGNIMFLKV